MKVDVPARTEAGEVLLTPKITGLTNSIAPNGLLYPIESLMVVVALPEFKTRL